MVKKVEVQVKDYSHYSDLTDAGFEGLVTEMNRLSELKKSTEADYKAKSEELQALMSIYLPEGERSVLWSGRPVTLASGRSASKINVIKLVQAGVAPETIEACTDPGSPYTYIVIGKLKEAKE